MVGPDLEAGMDQWDPNPVAAAAVVVDDDDDDIHKFPFSTATVK
jgi:hypothetical protein